MVSLCCSGAQKTVAIETAIMLLEELGAHGEVAELAERLRAWSAAIDLFHGDRFEYLEKLELLARRLLSRAERIALTPSEVTALQDIHLFLREAHREPSTDEHVLTAEERLATAEQRFRDTYGRDPLALSDRLTRYARHAFRAERLGPPAPASGRSTRASQTPR